MLFQDLRYAVAAIRRSPGFAFTVVVTLALSVGVATAVFCVIDNVILRPLPYAHPEKIVDIETRSRSGYQQPASWPSYMDERAQIDGLRGTRRLCPLLQLHRGNAIERTGAAG